jgi:hypothetical protein
MMLPSADSIGAENQARKPKGIGLDSVSPESALTAILPARHNVFNRLGPRLVPPSRSRLSGLACRAEEKMNKLIML